MTSFSTVPGNWLGDREAATDGAPPNARAVYAGFQGACIHELSYGIALELFVQRQFYPLAVARRPQAVLGRRASNERVAVCGTQKKTAKESTI